MSLVGDLASNRDLFDSLLIGPVLRTFLQYSVAFCSRLKADIYVISSAFVRLVIPEKVVQGPHHNGDKAAL